MMYALVPKTKELSKMGLFDNIGKKISENVQSATNKKGENVSIVFNNLPDNYEQFVALPQAGLSTPFETAAMTVLAFCFFPQDKEMSYKMIQFLKGPAELSGMQKQFIADRFMDCDYIPRSYFKGATPDNDYAPSQPYTIEMFTDARSFENEGYVNVRLKSGGADSPRNITVRQAKDGKWYLWEQYILVGIREPESSNPWA
jgi:hypothetical protein